MGKDKKQHYIPQCYLRLFSDDQKHIWTFDKKKGSEYSSTITDVCTKNDFYTISEEYVESNEGVSPLSLEKDFFADWYEPKFSEYLQTINYLAIEAINSSHNIISLNDEQKFSFAKLLAIQWFRLPSIKYDNEATFDEFMPKVMRLFKEGLAKEMDNPNIAKLDVRASIADKSVYHAKNTFLKEELVGKYAAELSKNIWTFSFSKDGDFYTSDFPITVNAHEKNVRPICQGLAQYGAEVTYPLSKNLALTIWDKEYFVDKDKNDLSLCTATPKEIRAFNALRYAYAQRQLFSYKNNFEVVKYMTQFCPISLNPFKTID